MSSRELVHQFLEGYNGTIFAYGQSGSGKTFTMLGDEQVTEALLDPDLVVPPEVQEKYGVIPRAIEQIFMAKEEGERVGINFEMKVSYFEIYNEELNDILIHPPLKNLKVRMLPQGLHIEGGSKVSVLTPEEIFGHLSNGTANKAVTETKQNTRSSRSHTLFILYVKQTSLHASTKDSMLNLVDLAGSERLDKTGATGATLKEGTKINLSLTMLGRVIQALTEGHKTVPYRDSKLTVMLKESLGGDSKTSLVCTASRQMVHLEETKGTLRFASRAKKI